MIFYILIGLISGVISGMGIGGGTILIPALVIFGGVSQQAAQNINLLYFIPTATIALFVHFKNDNIEKSIILKLVLFGVVLAIVGSYIAASIEPSLLKKAFGVFLLVMGVAEIKK